MKRNWNKTSCNKDKKEIVDIVHHNNLSGVVYGLWHETRRIKKPKQNTNSTR